MTFALKYGGSNIYNEMKEKLAVFKYCISHNSRLYCHSPATTTTPCSWDETTTATHPPSQYRMLQKTLSACCLWMRWAGTYPITDFLSDAGHKLTDIKTGILEHVIGTISAFNVL